MTRKLASIQAITNIRPIDGKDMIEQVNINGWNIIVRKAENYKEGDLCVYFEIDSLLPKRPEFEFLESKKYIIKTMKMGGVLSQGIVFPMSILPKGKYKIDQDVTKVLKVQQYNSDSSSDKKRTFKDKIIGFLIQFEWFRKRYVKSRKRSAKLTNFPSWIVKTDGVLYIKSNNKLFNTINKNNDKVIISALFLRSYLHSL